MKTERTTELQDRQDTCGAALDHAAVVAIVGSGIMGVGIAQLAAVAGHRVVLYDIQSEALSNAIQSLNAGIHRLVERAHLSAEDGQQAFARVTAANSLTELTGAGLVVEAIAEDLESKRTLFNRLEAVVSKNCILASNTSSLSITAIASQMQYPERVVGMHFFNPVHAMQLVEVVRGLATSDRCAQTVHATAVAWGKAPVYTRSTPGFIVNRVARPYYAEGLRLLKERAGTPASIDAAMRDAGGFRMGPFELMDLIGHDTNLAVTKAMFQAYFCDQRFTPSVLQQELVDARYLGRKSGRGFYQYGEDALPPEAVTEPIAERPKEVSLIGEDIFVAAMKRRYPNASVATPRDTEEAAVKAGTAVLVLTDGRTASQRAVDTGSANTVIVDLALDFFTAKTVAVARAGACSDQAFREAVGLLQGAGYSVIRLHDLPALAVLRTVAMLVNEAADVVNEGVCTVADLDAAMVKGVNYPRGPLAWADALGVRAIQTALKNLAKFYGEDRYRISPLVNEMVLEGKTFYELDQR